MSLQVALAFLAAVRQGQDVQDQIAALGPAITTLELSELATRIGFPCSAAEVQAAFRHDWTMRWFHHAHRDGAIFQ